MRAIWIRRADVIDVAPKRALSLRSRRARVLRALRPAKLRSLASLGPTDLLLIHRDASALDLDWELLPYDGGRFSYTVVRVIESSGATAPAAAYLPPPVKLVATVDARGDLHGETADLLRRVRAATDHHVIDVHGASIADLALRILRWNPRLVAVLTHGSEEALELQDASALPVTGLEAALRSNLPYSALRLLFLGACESARSIAPRLVSAGLALAIAFEGKPHAAPVKAAMKVVAESYGHEEIPRVLLAARNAAAATEAEAGIEPTSAAAMRVFARRSALRRSRTPEPRDGELGKRCRHEATDWLRQFVGRDVTPESGLAFVAACRSCQRRLAELRERYRTAAHASLRELIAIHGGASGTAIDRASDAGLAWDVAVGHLLATGLLEQPSGWVGGSSPWPVLLPGPGLTSVDGLRGCLFFEGPIEGELCLRGGTAVRVTFGDLVPHALEPGVYDATAWRHDLGTWRWCFTVTRGPRPSSIASALMGGYFDDVLDAYDRDSKQWTFAHAALLRRRALMRSINPRMANAIGGMAQWLEVQLADLA